jgi:hypothetical protein
MKEAKFSPQLKSVLKKVIAKRAIFISKEQAERGKINLIFNFRFSPVLSLLYDLILNQLKVFVYIRGVNETNTILLFNLFIFN